MSNNDKPFPNPFDFVSFSKSGPKLWKNEVLDAMGLPVSGYLELKLSALTPVHVVGQVKPGNNSRLSYFVRQNGLPFIPAATIRGCLRAFVEALTDGWISQADEEYPKVNGKEKRGKGRHIGFRTFEPYETKYLSKTQSAPNAVNSSYKPGAGNMLDLASYLFGVVVESDNEGKASHEALARKSRILIEDAFFGEEQLTGLDTYHLPDLAEAAFMGGGKPSASNWWYFYPAKIRKRRVYTNGGIRETAEFIGEKLRGRKFYFHQDPERCTRWYEQKWDYGSKRREPVFLQALKTGGTTGTFRIYLDEVPSQLVQLFIWVLLPGNHIRHKLGYGKAYGYGSVQFSLVRAMLRYPHENRIPVGLQDLINEVKSWAQIAWDKNKIEAIGLSDFIDWSALDQLAQILTWDGQGGLLFTYPPFAREYFQQPVLYDNPRILSATSIFPNTVPIPDEITGKKVAQVMYLDQSEKRRSPSKKTIDFRVYQENSAGWDVIKKRKP